MPKTKPKTPKQLQARIAMLRKRIASWKCDALLVTNPRDIRYLTGFIGDDSWALVRARSAQAHVISDYRFEQQIKHEAPHVTAIMRKTSLADVVKNLADRCGLVRIALQSDYLTVTHRKTLSKKMGASTLKNVDDGMLDQRAVKDGREILAIREALAIQQEAFRKTLRFIKPGRTEYEIAAHLEYQMRLLGADGVSFPSIVAADENAALPHAIPGKRKVKRGGIVLVDWGAMFQGYCSDLTRVIALGSMPRKMREIYRIVLEAQCAAVAAIAPGKALKDVDKVARDIIKDAGYGKQFGHSLGHGIGLDIHEQPVLSTRVKGELAPGQVVTVEPGVYLPGVGGVRIEDDVLVTVTGRRVLSDLPKRLDLAII